MPSPAVKLDFSQDHATEGLLPQPAVLSASWDNLHLELHQQPTFDTPEHQSPWHVVAIGLATAAAAQPAAGERWLDGKLRPERRQSGDIAIIPADVAQRCNWQTTAEFGILAIAPTLLQQVGQDWVSDRLQLVPHFMGEQDALIQGIFAGLRDELTVDQIGGDLLVDSLKTTLAIHLIRHYCTTRPKLAVGTNSLSQRQLKQVREYINEHLQQNLKLVELAAIAQISPYHFLRLFKQGQGITPHQYILQCRLEKARQLLRDRDLSLAAIAAQVGFCDQSHMTRCFQRRLGVTPKQLRQQ